MDTNVISISNSHSRIENAGILSRQFAPSPKPVVISAVAARAEAERRNATRSPALSVSSRSHHPVEPELEGNSGLLNTASSQMSEDLRAVAMAEPISPLKEDLAEAPSALPSTAADKIDGIEEIGLNEEALVHTVENVWNNECRHAEAHEKRGKKLILIREELGARLSDLKILLCRLGAC